MEEAILAVSSAPGRGVRGLIRAGGQGIEPWIHSLLGRSLEPRKPTPCRLRMAQGQGDSQKDISLAGLPCLALYFRAPASFTGQSMLEIQLPGHPALLDRALAWMLRQARQMDLPMRLAEPGEFTRRAFLAGKLDLTQAEGIAATIGAISDAQLQAAALLRQGMLGRWAELQVERLGGLLALVEAGIDFVDQEDVHPIGEAELATGLAEVEREVVRMLEGGPAWANLEAQPWVVLVGRPNAGKSTLFNALLGRERAVISPMAGTTRDALCEPLKVPAERGGEVELLLVDVAGIDDPRERMDGWMQEAARQAIQRADLLLLLEPADGPHEGRDEIHAMASLLRPGARSLRVMTKADLKPSVASGSSASDIEGDQALAVSAKLGWGVEELRAKIGAMVGRAGLTLAGQMIFLQPRHVQELAEARAWLAEARAGAQGGGRALPEMELAADRMRAALDHLGAVGGRLSADDVLGKVFSTFCIGK